jgi:hypothetical protein
LRTDIGYLSHTQSDRAEYGDNFLSVDGIRIETIRLSLVATCSAFVKKGHPRGTHSFRCPEKMLSLGGFRIHLTHTTSSAISPLTSLYMRVSMEPAVAAC